MGGAALFLYAVFFSFAYLQLNTGVGALVLFGTVQLSMIAAALYAGDKLPWHHIAGILIAFSGLCFLIYTGLDGQTTKLSVMGFVLMVVAGIAWGTYTLLGKTSNAPFIDTSANFATSVVFCIPLLAVYMFIPLSISTQGFWLAVLSGIVTSALGYAIWYVALPNLSTVQAGVVQLLVPIIAAIGGVIWVSEGISAALIISQIMVLGGIALVMVKVKQRV